MSSLLATAGTITCTYEVRHAGRLELYQCSELATLAIENLRHNHASMGKWLQAHTFYDYNGLDWTTLDPVEIAEISIDCCAVVAHHLSELTDESVYARLRDVPWIINEPAEWDWGFVHKNRPSKLDPSVATAIFMGAIRIDRCCTQAAKWTAPSITNSCQIMKALKKDSSLTKINCRVNCRTGDLIVAISPTEVKGVRAVMETHHLPPHRRFFRWGKIQGSRTLSPRARAILKLTRLCLTLSTVEMRLKHLSNKECNRAWARAEIRRYGCVAPTRKCLKTEAASGETLHGDRLAGQTDWAECKAQDPLERHDVTT